MCLFTFAVVVTGIFGCFFLGITQTPLVQNQRKHSNMQMRKNICYFFLKHVNNLEDKHQNKKTSCIISIIKMHQDLKK